MELVDKVKEHVYANYIDKSCKWNDGDEETIINEMSNSDLLLYIEIALNELLNNG